MYSELFTTKNLKGSIKTLRGDGKKKQLCDIFIEALRNACLIFTCVLRNFCVVRQK